jgi:hypothetical protein
LASVLNSGVPYLFFVSSSPDLYALSNPSGTWTATNVTGTSAPATGTNLTAMVFDSPSYGESTEVYYTLSNGNVEETFTNGTGGWLSSDLMGLVSAPDAASGAAITSHWYTYGKEIEIILRGYRQ